jgi:spore maturation protein CgeB
MRAIFDVGDLATNNRDDNGLNQLFQDGVHVMTYQSDEELSQKVRYYLKHGNLRQ